MDPQLPVTPLFLGRSGEWWDSGLIACAVIAGVATTAVGVFTAGSIFAHKREAGAAERSLETYKLGVQGQVAAAHTAGLEAGKLAGDASGVAESARADVARANAEAARSNAQAAEANARAQEASLALAQFKAPRAIDPAMKSRLIKRLSAFSGTPFIISIQISGEASDFATQISQTLREAGWRQEPISGNQGSYSIPGQPALGIASLAGIAAYVDNRRPDLIAATAAFRSAFQNENFAIDAKRIVDDSESVKDAVHIYVGEKPRSQPHGMRASIGGQLRDWER